MSIFEPLDAVSKFMEGENYILVSSYFSDMRKIEDIMQPRSGDYPEVAQIRATMYNDHFSSRVTLDQAVKSPLCVMGTLLDPRYVCFSSRLHCCYRYFVYQMARESRSSVE